MPTDEEQAPGLDAINRALTKVYGEKPYGLLSGNDLTGAGSSALECISVYRSQSDTPHWHYVTCGFSELFEKESENTELSGLGFELTFRLAMSAKVEPQIPEWPYGLLNDLARVILENGTHLQAGDHLSLTDPLDPESGSLLNSILFVRDSELSSIETKNGRVEFIQAVGITDDELKILERWNGNDFIESAKAALGKQLVTRLNRKSIASDPDLVGSFEKSVTADGASDITIKCPVAEWIFTYKASASLSVDCVVQLQNELVKIISGGRKITIIGAESLIVFRSGKEANFSIENDALIIDCTAADAQSFVDQLNPVVGSYSFANLPVGFEVIDGHSQTMDREVFKPSTQVKANNKKTRK